MSKNSNKKDKYVTKKVFFITVILLLIINLTTTLFLFNKIKKVNDTMIEISDGDNKYLNLHSKMIKSLAKKMNLEMKPIKAGRPIKIEYQEINKK